MESENLGMLVGGLIAVAVLVAVWLIEYRPTLYDLRYLLGEEEFDRDTIPSIKLTPRIVRRAKQAAEYGRTSISNGVEAEWIDPTPTRPQGTVFFHVRHQNLDHFPLTVEMIPRSVAEDHSDSFLTHETSVRIGEPLDGTEWDAYQWMMEQMSHQSCYDIAKRAYICEQDSHRGASERMSVEAEYADWIIRKYL